MTAENQPGKATQRPVSPLLALILSAVILPGLGQLVTGRVRKGALMSVVPLIWLPVMLIKVVRDLSKVMPGLADQTSAGAAVSFSDVQQALHPMAGDLIWLLAPLAAVWLWSLIDSIMFIRQSKPVA